MTRYVVCCNGYVIQMALILVQVTIALPLECLILVVIVYLTFCYLNLRRWGASILGRSLNGISDSQSEFTSDESSVNCPNFLALTKVRAIVWGTNLNYTKSSMNLWVKTNWRI